MTVEQSASFLECIKDSPNFRCNLATSFKRITDFHDAVTDLSDSFSLSIKSGITFSCHYQSFCGKLSNLQGLYKEQSTFQEEIVEAAEVLSYFKEHFSGLLEGLHLVQREFKVFTDNYKQIDTCRKQWQKANENHDGAIQKCASTPRIKSLESQDVDKAYVTIKNEYQQCSLKYLTMMERWDVGRQNRLLRVCVAIAGSEREYFKRGSDSIARLTSWDQKVNSEMVNLEARERRVSLVDTDHKRQKDKNVPPPIPENTAVKPVIEGYLYKSGKKAWQKWQRRWFKVEHNQLLWCKRSETTFSILEADLRICTAKELPDYDRRFCFELIAPERTIILQAEDEERMRRWIQCFQCGMSNQMGTLNQPKMIEKTVDRDKSFKNTVNLSNSLQKNEDRKSKLIEELLQVRGNSLCCDCGDLKPRWSSSSLGITLCTECSGSHRSLGVHVSKVRSITLDNWEPEMLSVMFLLGNEVVNFIFESDQSALKKALAEGISKPNSNTDMAKRKIWAKVKWEDKRFVLRDMKQLFTKLQEYIHQNIPLFSECLRSEADFSTSDDLLKYGLEIHCLPIMMLSLCLGANPNGKKDNLQLIPLHMAAASDFWPGCEFLILNGAKIDLVDDQSQTALHKACEYENVLVVWLLLKRGARQNIRNAEEKDALHVAISTANANTVTLLRLHTLNENTKEANLGSNGDETVNDVFRDFTNRAFDQLQEWFVSDSSSFHRMNSSKSLSNTYIKM